MERLTQKRMNFLHDITLSDLERCIMSNERFFWEHSTEVILQLQKPEKMPGRDLLIFRGPTQTPDDNGRLRNTKAYQGDLEPLANIELKTCTTPANINRQLFEATSDCLRFGSWGIRGYKDRPMPFKYNIGIVCYIDQHEALEFAAVSINYRQEVYQLGENPDVKIFNTYYSMSELCKGINFLINVISNDQGAPDLINSLAKYDGTNLQIDFNRFALDPRVNQFSSLPSPEIEEPPPEPIHDQTELGEPLPLLDTPPAERTKIERDVEASKLTQRTKDFFALLYPIIKENGQTFKLYELEEQFDLHLKTIRRYLDFLEIAGFIHLDMIKKKTGSSRARLTQIYIELNIVNV